MVQALTFLAFAPSKVMVSHSSGWDGFRALVGSQPLILQVLEIMILTDLAQYWFHRAFHRVPVLWGFHAVHHRPRRWIGSPARACISSRLSHCAA